MRGYERQFPSLSVGWLVRGELLGLASSKAGFLFVVIANN